MDTDAGTSPAPSANQCDGAANNPAVRFFSSLATPWKWVGRQLGLVSAPAAEGASQGAAAKAEDSTQG